MIDIAEAEQRVLAALEEAQEDSITAVLNMIIEPTGDNEEIILYDSVAKSLIDRGFIRLAIARGVDGKLLDETVDQSLLLFSNFLHNFLFDAERRIWTLAYDRGFGADRKPFPNFVLTKSGLEASISVLKKRGWMWWQKPV